MPGSGGSGGSSSAVTHAPTASQRRRRPTVALATVVVLAVLLSGVALRLVRITDPPLAYQATRAYHSALLARDYSQALGADAAGLDATVVRAASPRELEPPVLEVITAFAWRVVDAEPLWIPRILSIVAWSVGGWCLYLLLRRLASTVAGIAAVAVWTFLPFAVTTSRTFQPDPAMVAALVAAILALVVEDDDPTTRRLVSAGALAGLAVFLKLPAAFFVAPVFATLTIRGRGWRGLWSRRSAAYTALAFGPALLWELYGFTIGGFLRDQAGNRIEPHLLGEATFWRGWGDLAVRSFGVIVPLAEAVGIAVAHGRARWVGCAVAFGYVAFGTAFTYHYMTHDYYHLPVMIVLALGIGLLADRLWSFVRARHGDVRSVSAAAAIALVVAVGFGVSTEPLRFPLLPAAIPDETRVADHEAPPIVGELVDHSPRVVFLAADFGLPLMFYGGIAGVPWPERDDARAALAELRAGGDADFFVATQQNALRDRPVLRAALDRFPIVAATADYTVYDLRRR